MFILRQHGISHKWQAGGPAHARDFKAVLCKRFSLRASQKQEAIFQLPTLLPEPSCRGKAFSCDWKNMYYVCGGWQLETNPEFIRPELISRGRRVGDRTSRCFPAVPYNFYLEQDKELQTCETGLAFIITVWDFSCS